MATPIEQRYIDEHQKCADFYSTSRNLFPNGVTHDARNLKPFPYFVSHAQGARKWDVDGHEIIDYTGGHGALLLGHNHPDIVTAVAEQMAKGTHYAASTEIEIRWAQWVRELIPCAEKLRFVSSGTEATLMALRMARSYTGKTKVIQFHDHFHGWHDYLRAHDAGHGGIPEETGSTVVSIPANDIGVVEAALKDNDVAAVIIEPTGSHMGQAPVRPSFLNELREITERLGVVLIFDEVVTGFRTSKGGAQAYFGITPDICTLAKILGGGLPAGAVTGKVEIIDMIQLQDDPDFNANRRIAHFGTFNANPLSAAAGARALELVATQPINDRADAAAARLKEGFNDVLTRLEIPGCSAGIASAIFLRLGVDHECDKEVCILTPEDQHTVEDATRSHQLALALYNHGVSGGPRFIVSSAHTDGDVDETVAASEKALLDLRAAGLV
jgi:glutamate-1-semialdehyde 2,1-aminomutase